MKRKTVLILLLTLTSCEAKDQKFNSQTWKEAYIDSYSKRELLVNDFIKNHMYRGMSFHEIIKLLGEPEIVERNENFNIGYILNTSYDQIDPIKGKDLIINLSKDSIVLDYKVTEWKK
nr:hypothetical protein [uncultured Bacteroides sp.]